MVSLRKRWFSPEQERFHKLREKYEQLLERLDDVEFDYEVYGPDEKNPESGFRVEVKNGWVEATRWESTEPPDDPDYREDWEENPVLRTDMATEIVELLGDKHLEAPALMELMQMPPEKRKRALIDLAAEYFSYYGGDESWVSEVGE